MIAAEMRPHLLHLVFVVVWMGIFVAPAATGRMTGRVVAADTGRPIKRARVFISAAELPAGRGMLTDDSGVFAFTDLPAGRYTINASKSGYIQLSYGQRRPLQAVVSPEPVSISRRAG